MDENEKALLYVVVTLPNPFHLSPVAFANARNKIQITLHLLPNWQEVIAYNDGKLPDRVEKN